MSDTMDFETQLQSIPIRNEELTLSPSKKDPDSLIVEVQLHYAGILKPLASWVRARKRKRYELVGLSREMFEKIDGKMSVEQLLDWMCEKEALTFLEGRALVLHYLRDLMKRGLIVIVGLES